MTRLPSTSRPRIERTAARRQLVVDGSPFLVLGGELHNSSGGGRAALLNGLDRVVAMNANTALVPISWELFEPAEGSFDVELVDIAVSGARERGLRLVPLWFGSWKNGRSSYVPAWVKTDTDRFPRAVVSRGTVTEHLSPFGDEALRSDATAFAHLMAHLATSDEDGTVVMVQVQNEVGLLGDSRDRSAAAERAFRSEVPSPLLDLLSRGVDLSVTSAWESAGRRTSGNWATVFGGDTRGDEAFMAWAYGSFVETVAAAGAAELPVPLFTNAWLDSEIDLPGFAVTGGQRPGTYPSGGPVAGVVPIWRTFAPTLDVLAPDIYVGDIDLISGRFARANDGALLIPEMRRDYLGAGQMAVAVGAHGALGVSPFGIDSGDPDEVDAVADLYALLAAIADRLTTADADSISGFQVTTRDPQEITVGSRRFRVRASRNSWDVEQDAHAYGVVVETGADEYLAVGRGFVLEPLAVDGRIVGILRVDEYARSGGGLVRTRRLNGDETRSGSAWVHPARGHAPTGALPIPSVGEGTGISTCVLYTLGS